MEIKIDMTRDEAIAIERLLATVLDWFGKDLSTAALGGAVRVRQALALGVKRDCVGHYIEQARAAR